jgi:hypothetical protein
VSLNEVPNGMLRSPNMTIPAVGPVVGGVKLSVAPPLIVTVGQELPLFFVNTSVTPVPLTTAPPLRVKLPPSM